MLRAFFGLTVGGCLSAGCGNQPTPSETPKAQGKGVEVVAPGVSVKAGDKGANVKFPGGEVNVKD